jgi:hypothetical protein
MHVHFIASPVLVDVGAASKCNAEWDFLRMLRDERRHSAESFLSAHAEANGPPSTWTRCSNKCTPWVVSNSRFEFALFGWTFYALSIRLQEAA